MKRLFTSKWLCLGLLLGLALSVILNILLLVFGAAILGSLLPNGTVVIMEDCCSPTEPLSSVETQPQMVWPLHKSTTPDYLIDSRHRLSSTFGPRLQASKGYRYDWHRGIDIPADCESPIYAIADGTVRIAGQHDSYSDKLVQLHHQKLNGDDFYSNYMHLASIVVHQNQIVAQGQLIGHTGESDIQATGVCTPGYDPSAGNGFDHLHFEIRERGFYQKHATHPLRYLPYPDATAPTPIICSVDTTESSRLSVTVRVQMLSNELDLNRIEVTVYDLKGESPRIIDQGIFDMFEWTQNYTSLNKSTKLALLDTAPAHDGVYDGDYGDGPVESVPYDTIVSPAKFNASRIYSLDVTFFELFGLRQKKDLLITANAIDIKGNRNKSSYRHTEEKLAQCTQVES